MEQRLNRLRQLMADADVDAMLVCQPENRRYLSGFTGSSGYLILTQDQAVLLTDFRYVEQAGKQAPHFRVVKHGSKAEESIVALVHDLGVKSLGFEQDYLTYATYKGYIDRLENVEFKATSGMVERLRQIKDASEIAMIREAAKIADATFNHILQFLRPGISEREVALEMEVFMRKQGASGSSFDTIVASGVRSSLPHGVASDKVLQKGDFITLDFGAYYEGYCSDITRTVSLGQPGDQLREIYKIVQESQAYALAHICSGMTGKQADALARDIIQSKGFGDHFGHGLGHGIGLAIHEDPRLSLYAENQLEAGMVVTVEPGIYIPNVGGVRIEDDIVITDTGVELLTHATKELLILE